MLLTIEGSISSGTVRQALDSLQQSHWQLRSFIDRHFAVRVAYSYGKIPLKLEHIDEPELNRYIERELEERFNTEQAPLARCLLTHDKNDSRYLILTLHHSLFDGFSAKKLAFEIATLLKVPEGRAPDVAVPVPDVIEDCAQAYFPSKHRATWAAGRSLWKMAKERFSTLQHRAGAIRAIAAVSGTDWRPGVLLTELDERCVSRIRSTAREMGTTVHGALCAAQLLSVGHSMGLEFPHVLATSTAVDLRPYLLPEVRGRVGALFSAVITKHRITPSTTLWSLAADIKNTLSAALAQDEHIGAVPLVDVAMRLLLLLHSPTRLSGELLVRLSERLVSPHLMVSNMGAIQPAEKASGVRVVAASFAVGGPPDWNFGSTATTFNGRLYWNFLYNRSSIGSELAEKIAQRSITILSSLSD